MQALAASAEQEVAQQLQLERLREACTRELVALEAASEQLRDKRLHAAAPLAPKRQVALAAEAALQLEVETLRCTFSR